MASVAEWMIDGMFRRMSSAIAAMVQTAPV
jgi:hypothetical protein